ncbi:F-box protein FBW2-like [Gossypium australe]|uniref:F-box protein FBW2-like n=1 Tax=Gossypium australe TaxID=47621 RepID=A0A5B6WB74_9ROSI|nr:F-box protein FBW2-like [Gossypium australe]
MEEEQSEFRHWDELLPDVLGLIFSYLSLQELPTIIPCVRKSWRKAITGPYCCQDIDLAKWSRRCRSHHLDRMLPMLITRSNGSLRSLHVSGLQNDTIFSFIKEKFYLLLPFFTIAFLDLSYCRKIDAYTIKAIGKHCKLLVTLPQLAPTGFGYQFPTDDQADAIATTIPRLKHLLEFAFHPIGTEIVLSILSGCPQLEFLDMVGCIGAELDHEFLKQKCPKLKIWGPILEKNSWDDRLELVSILFTTTKFVVPFSYFP